MTARGAPDAGDTIAAVASARGGSERGVVRVAGPDAIPVCQRLLAADGADRLATDRPRRVAGVTLRVSMDGAERDVPADAFVWPTQRSYTRQPAVEWHTIGSPPVLDAVVRALVAAGARLAEPGEFTLRALLAGRLDLTQAEAVLGVIDAPDREALDRALGRMAGGLSEPLHALRAELLSLLADLEAGLDFVEEEDIRFIEAEELLRRLADAQRLIGEAAQQVAGRDASDRLPRVAIVGPPNVGKSRLFNVLVERFGVRDAAPSLVADAVGVTRDAVEAELSVGGSRFSLVDTAGDDASPAIDAIDAAARRGASDERSAADLVLRCTPASRVDWPATLEPGEVRVATMTDRVAGYASRPGWLATSAAKGEGVTELAEAIAEQLAEIDHGTPALAEHTRTGLTAAAEAMSRAVDAAVLGEELVALELRSALDALGRVVGEVVTDEVLGEVFGRFCIGK